ncbi:hypothetical protein ARMSODRAFT_535512 [Armillaria solidipes]|uniref:Uncharacterized protein n=1 Tax=Armillaria solidipes TaxID=1076256 RepID=A0A2H3AXN4_9AGAR|nr:hypothetical protein ARMSODRAFT_535512 [Armillaria solidipes]
MLDERVPAHDIHLTLTRPPALPAKFGSNFTSLSHLTFSLATSSGERDGYESTSRQTLLTHFFRCDFQLFSDLI